MSLGTKLRQLRQNRNWSQADVAHQLDISQPAYHKWESDASKPSLENILKISKFYEIDVSDLLEDGSTNITNNDCTITIGNNNMGNPNSVFNMQSPELIESIIKNQDEMTKLVAAQNKLIEALLKK